MSNEDKRTVTVRGYFGKDKQITKEDFLTTWTETITQLGKIANTTKDFEQVRAIETTVTGMADREFERLFKVQA